MTVGTSRVAELGSEFVDTGDCPSSDSDTDAAEGCVNTFRNGLLSYVKSNVNIFIFYIHADDVTV